ncbi:hypothetical protein B0H14DRAFT_2647290 [Mycena olivaceomarginata]|nr:hypothetical protein B0H14DRAFT_2647290 [Mycena olivaceomarginata]
MARTCKKRVKNANRRVLGKAREFPKRNAYIITLSNGNQGAVTNRLQNEVASGKSVQETNKIPTILRLGCGRDDLRVYAMSASASGLVLDRVRGQRIVVGCPVSLGSGLTLPKDEFTLQVAESGCVTVHGSMATTRPAIRDDDKDLDVEEATVATLPLPAQTVRPAIPDTVVPYHTREADHRGTDQAGAKIITPTQRAPDVGDDVEVGDAEGGAVNTLAVADMGIDGCASPAYEASGARFVVSGGSVCCGAGAATAACCYAMEGRAGVSGDDGTRHLGLADRAEGAVSVRVKPRAHGEQNLWYKREPEILRRD